MGRDAVANGEHGTWRVVQSDRVAKGNLHLVATVRADVRLPKLPYHERRRGQDDDPKHRDQ
jgi:hypothetical protein